MIRNSIIKADLVGELICQKVREVAKESESKEDSIYLLVDVYNLLIPGAKAVATDDGRAKLGEIEIDKYHAFDVMERLVSELLEEQD